ncbi:hypothetical protein WA158_001064 [Blastocystis sp. Blastoise]
MESDTVNYIRSRTNQNEILISFVTKKYHEMTIMFYENSLNKLNISNYVFICGDEIIYKSLVDNNINAIRFSKSVEDDGKTTYNSPLLNIMMENRVKTIIQFLEEGFSILLSDVDILLLDNPFHYFNHTYDANMSIESGFEYRSVNGGFFYLKSTALVISFMYDILRYMKKNLMNDQDSLNQLLFWYTKNNVLSWEPLDQWRFQDGRSFFYINRHGRNINDCKTCVMIHNNWIIGNAAKIYRFKELGIYTYNKEQYYQTQDKLFLTFSYSNKIRYLKDKQKILTVMSMLALYLNRTLILPNFYIYDSKRRQLEQKFQEEINFHLLHYRLENRTTPIYTPKYPKTYNYSDFRPYPGAPSQKMREIKNYMMKKQRKHIKLTDLNGTLNELFCVKYYHDYMGDQYREHSFLYNSYVSKKFQNSFLSTPVIQLSDHVNDSTSFDDIVRFFQYNTNWILSFHITSLPQGVLQSYPPPPPPYNDNNKHKRISKNFVIPSDSFQFNCGE